MNQKKSNRTNPAWRTRQTVLLFLVWLPPFVFSLATILALKIPVYASWFLWLNLWAVLIFALDKRFAVRGTQRIPERVLFLVLATGGVLGGMLGMVWFHHKTNKMTFTMVLILSALLHGWIILKLIQSKF